MSVAYVIAWVAPLLVGTALVVLGAGRGAAPRWSASLGGGLTLGLLSCALAVDALGEVEVKAVRAVLLPLLAMLGATLALFAFARRRGIAPMRSAPPARMHPLAWGLPVLLAAHAWLIAGEVLLRPPYPWDAWAIWLLKPKAWMLDGTRRPQTHDRSGRSGSSAPG